MKKTYIIMLVIISIGLIGLFFYFKNESVHVFKQYSTSGKLLKTHEYIIKYGDTILQGKFMNYNESGVKIAEGQYVNNEPNGICSYYYDNGKIESIFYRKNSKIDFEAYYYNHDGKIRKYVMCNDKGEPKFIIDFDGKKVKKYDGYALYPLNQYKIEKDKIYKIYTQDTLKVGDVIKYDYLLANIPNAEKTFKIETDGLDNSKAKRTITKEVPTRIVVKEILTKKGLNRIKAITQYTFNDNVTHVKNDTVSFDVNVK